MKVFKSKSLVPYKTNEQIKNECSTVRFISFEACIQLFREKYNLMELKENPIGYRVIEQGITIGMFILTIIRWWYAMKSEFLND
jgi:uncharacterized membrane protein